MCIQNNTPNEIKLEHKIIGGLCRSDDNLLSFLCGIFSNIPISLCFVFTSLGNSALRYINFALTLFALAVSVALVVFAFKFTIRKMRYISPRLANKGDADKNNEINHTLTEYMPLSNAQKNASKKQITKYQYLKRPLLAFIICAVLLFVSVGGLWILSSLISIC